MKLVTFTSADDDSEIVVNPEAVSSVRTNANGQVVLHTVDGGFYRLKVASITDVTAALQATP